MTKRILNNDFEKMERVLFKPLTKENGVSLLPTIKLDVVTPDMFLLKGK